MCSEEQASLQSTTIWRSKFPRAWDVQTRVRKREILAPFTAAVVGREFVASGPTDHIKTAESQPVLEGIVDDAHTAACARKNRDLTVEAQIFAALARPYAEMRRIDSCGRNHSLVLNGIAVPEERISGK